MRCPAWRRRQRQGRRPVGPLLRRPGSQGAHGHRTSAPADQGGGRTPGSADWTDGPATRAGAGAVSLCRVRGFEVVRRMPPPPGGGPQSRGSSQVPAPTAGAGRVGPRLLQPHEAGAGRLARLTALSVGPDAEPHGWPGRRWLPVPPGQGRVRRLGGSVDRVGRAERRAPARTPGRRAQEAKTGATGPRTRGKREPRPSEHSGWSQAQRAAPRWRARPLHRTRTRTPCVGHAPPVARRPKPPAS